MTKELELPDFDDMMTIIKSIASLSKDVAMLKLQIALEESKIVTDCTTNSAYWIGGKTPSMSLIESTYKITGFKGELIPKRSRLIEISSELDELRMVFQLMRDKISLYQSESANKRAGLFTQ